VWVAKDLVLVVVKAELKVVGQSREEVGEFVGESGRPLEVTRETATTRDSVAMSRRSEAEIFCAVPGVNVVSCFARGTSGQWKAAGQGSPFCG
jgi:hypothetical protein